MAEEVRHTAPERGEILAVERSFVHAAVHFERADRSDHDHRVRDESRRAAFYIKELFRAEIRAEAGLGHGVLRRPHRHSCCKHRAAPVGDVRERPTVNEGGSPLKSLDEVRLDGILQQRRHRPLRLQLPACDGLIVIGVADNYPRKAFLKVGQRGREAQNGHYLARDGDIKAVLARNAVISAAHAVEDEAKLAVVHVHTALPCDAPGIYIQGVPLLYVVIEHGGEKIICRAYGVDVAGKVEVYILHRYHLRVSAAAGPALDAEHRAERRLAHVDDGALAYPAERIGKTDGGGRLALAGGRWGHGRYQHELSLRPVLIEIGEADLGLVPAVLLKISFVYPREGGYLAHRAHDEPLRYFNIA